jgi:diadenosine tetraphosphate (Ap4A) HIT family hydrolase
MPVFELDPRLAANSVGVRDLPLSSLRLVNDAQYVWLMLIPRIAGAVELTDLTLRDRHDVLDEVTAVADAVKAETGCHKLNIAAIGNIVAQLHIHVIGRFQGDATWPQPVWGRLPAVPYVPDRLESLRASLAQRLAGA